MQTGTSANSEEPDEMPHNALVAKIKKQIFTTEMHHDLENLPVILIIQYGQFHKYSINIYGKIHQNERG